MQAPKKRNPKKTARDILDAATSEFAENGFGGARIDVIAERATSNKRMIYHYYGGKDDLFLAVLENSYAKIRRSESELNLENLPPVDAIRKLIQFTYNYFTENPDFISLLHSENLFDAVHLKKSKKILEMHSPLISKLDAVLTIGVKAGVFRDEVTAVDLYISIAALGYFYLSNSSTLGAIFNKDLKSKKAINARGRHIEDVVLGYLRP
jgi:AcrR family transcriptional regulator|tara:strand:- start:10113 stop:10739 length:627 start_codon:yes stop_codon:yes gene_type:complete